MKTQTQVDEEKTDALFKLVMGMSLSRPVILIFSDDTFCWLQLYVIQFLERDSFVFIEESKKDDIKLPKLPDNIKVRYYKDEDDLMKKTQDSIQEYEKLLKEELIE